MRIRGEHAPWITPVILAVSTTAACLAPVIAEPAGRRQAEVVGGIPDNDANGHEAAVLLYVQGSLCSGVLVAPNLVVTARHCVATNVSGSITCDPYGNGDGPQVGADVDPSSIEVYTGWAPDFWSGPPDATASLILHPAGDILCNRDIAVLVLDREVGTTVAAIRFVAGPTLHELVEVVGFGNTDPNVWSGGYRMRRSDLPVISSGFDWNSLTGEAEFVLGPSACSGDSGGPVFSMTTGGLLGVASRGGDCASANQLFTRLDPFRTLLEQGAAAAGASLTEDTGVPPPAPEVLDTGQGPCATGAECESLACLTTVDTPICTQLWCEQGQCPLGTLCLSGSFPSLLGDMPMCTPAPGACTGECLKQFSAARRQVVSDASAPEPAQQAPVTVAGLSLPPRRNDQAPVDVPTPAAGCTIAASRLPSSNPRAVMIASLLLGAGWWWRRCRGGSPIRP